MGMGAFFHFAKLLNDDRIRDLAYLQYRNVTLGGPLGVAGKQPPLWDAEPGLCVDRVRHVAGRAYLTPRPKNLTGIVPAAVRA